MEHFSEQIKLVARLARARCVALHYTLGDASNIDGETLAGAINRALDTAVEMEEFVDVQKTPIDLTQWLKDLPSADVG